MRRAFILLALLGLALTACGKSAKTSALAVTTSEPSAGKVEMTAPATVPAGLVKVTFKNAGQQPHDALFVRVDGDHAQQEVVDSVSSQGAPVPDWAHLEGGAGTAAPGQTVSATVNLAPGSHYLVDTQSDDNDNSFAKPGAIRPISVTGKASKADLPDASATITAGEYSFGVPTDLKAGTTAVKFENKGAQPHMLLAAPIVAGKSFDDVKAAFASEGPPSGPPPVDFEKVTGAQIIDPGHSEVATISLEKGDYAFVCFMSDRSGGPPHVAKGMIQQVTVS